jgi:hypothetical protein
MHPQSVGYLKYSIFPGENKQISDSMPSYAVQIRLGYDPIRIDPGSILDRIKQDRTGLSRIDPGSIL